MVTPTYGKGVDAATYENPVNATYDMIEKVATQILAETAVTDRLARFDKKPIDNGTTIEEYTVKLAQSTAFDPNDVNPFQKADPAVVVRYYKDWTRKKFRTTVNFNEARKVTLAGESVAPLAAEVVASTTKGDIYEKYTNVRDMFADAATKDYIVKQPAVVKTDYKGILKAIKDTVSGMSFANDDFNKAGIIRETPKDRITILMPYKIKNAIDVEELAGVFNLSKAEIGERIVEIDTGDNIYICDDRAVLVYTRLYEMRSIENTETLDRNYVLHTDRLYAISELFDATVIPLTVAAA